MRLRRAGPLVRWPVGAKFAAAVGAVVVCVLSVSVVAAIGLTHLRSDVERLIAGDLAGVRVIGDLAISLNLAEEAALAEQAAAGPGRATGATMLDEVLLPRLTEQLTTARERFAGNASASERLNRVSKGLDDYVALRAAAPVASGPADQGAQIGRVAATFDRMTNEVGAVRDDEFANTERSVDEARDTYASTQQQLIIGTFASVLVAVTAVLLLVRDLVPRLRSYAAFAGAVAAGRRVDRLNPRGTDELAHLGHALDDMVARTEEARLREQEQAEFVDTLQVTPSEEEAHELVQRHLQRSLPGSTVVVLTRNNSENRLEPATTVAPDSTLGSRLPGAEPRNCLALRFGRTHREDSARTPLLSCQLCAEQGSRTTCEPLLVAGEVIGAVLVTHPDPLDGVDESRIRNAVRQAAPVLGNLRNLALAEFRANNDSLTGLPNKRATDDTLKRMVALANRTITPLAAAMLDLDHFKQINDRFGHAKGDEVLAAVGAALRSCLRASDFAGRFGGEELLLLLPETTAQDAVALTERIRDTIASIRVPGVDRAITVSIGVADLIQHGGDAPGLLRQADRALYTAKATGRNRVVVAHADGPVADGGPVGVDEPTSNGVQPATAP